MIGIIFSNSPIIFLKIIEFEFRHKCHNSKSFKHKWTIFNLSCKFQVKNVMSHVTYNNKNNNNSINNRQSTTSGKQKRCHICGICISKEKCHRYVSEVTYAEWNEFGELRCLNSRFVLGWKNIFFSQILRHFWQFTEVRHFESLFKTVFVIWMLLHMMFVLTVSIGFFRQTQRHNYLTKTVSNQM